MTVYQCTCGARYRLPEGSAGKQARCNKCGLVFTVPGDEPAPSPPPPPPEDDDFWDLEANRTVPEQSDDGPSGDQSPYAVDSGGSFSVAPAADTGAGERLAAEDLVKRGRAVAEQEMRRRGFWADVGLSFAFFTEPHNLAMLIIVWFLHGCLPLLAIAARTCCYFGLGYVIVYGWLFSYWLNVIIEATAGEDRLPSLSLTEGVFDDIVMPLIKFTGASVLAWTPAIVCGAIIAGAQGTDVNTVVTALDPPIIVSIAVAMFLWPIVLLVTAVGGLLACARVDLLAKTVARTFPAYLAVCTLCAGTTALKVFAPDLISYIARGSTAVVVTNLFSALCQAYFSIVAMRIVGLYYHHFKTKFAWSWG